jgi:hypothetical protein
MRELFIYWRTPAATAAQAIEAASQWQARLRAQHPGLAATLFCRADDSGETATLMEVYGAPLDAALEKRIVDEGSRALAPWLAGQRHVEVFERCATAAAPCPGAAPPPPRSAGRSP